MGGLLDFEFSETYLGLTGALNTTNPLTDAASDPAMLSDLAGIESDHANGLASYHAATTENVLTGGDEAYDGSYWQARNPQNVLARVVGEPHPRVPGRRRVRHLPERRAARTTPSCRTPGPGRSATAPMSPGQRTTGPLSADRRPVGAPQRLLGRRRPARARVVRHLAQAREDRHGPHPDAASLLRPRQRAVRRDLDVSVHRLEPRRACTSAPAGRSPAPRRPAGADWTSLPLPAPARNADRRRRRRCPGASDSVVWSPTGAPCGRPIDQWSMGGICVPAGTAGSARPVRQRRPGLAVRAVGYHLHHRSADPRRDGRRTDHRHRLRELDHVGDPARRRARGRHAERRVLPAERGRAARLAAGGQPEPVVDGRRRSRCCRITRTRRRRPSRSPRAPSPSTRSRSSRRSRRSPPETACG